MTICHTCSDGKEKRGEKVYERGRIRGRKREKLGGRDKGGTKRIRG